MSNNLQQDINLVRQFDTALSDACAGVVSAADVLRALRVELAKSQYDGVTEGQALLMFDAIDAVISDFVAGDLQ